MVHKVHVELKRWIPAARDPEQAPSLAPAQPSPSAAEGIADGLGLKAEGKPKSPVDGGHSRAGEDSQALSERILGYRRDGVEIDHTFM